MNSNTLTRDELCSLFDHTNLKPYADRPLFEQLCREASENHFAMVAINSAPVSLCKQLLKGSGVQPQFLSLWGRLPWKPRFMKHSRQSVMEPMKLIM